MSRADLIVVAAVVAAVAFLCFTMGLFTRRSGDAELIRELEEELSARCLIRPPEMAHEPAPEPWVTDVADTTWDLPALTPPRGFIALPDWHAPLEELGLEEHVAAMGAELQEFVAALIASSEAA